MEAEEILAQMISPSETDIELIKKACDFSKKVHEGQVRDCGQPYFVHPLETAKYLAHIGMDSKTIAAGLLHDSVEDAKVEPEQLEKIFGKEVMFLVDGVTKLDKLKYTGTKRHSESLRKLFVATSKDIRVIIIKLADRLHNMRSLHLTTEEKRQRMARETLEIYAPLAHRLGIRKITRELEDLGFMHSDPKSYEKTKNILKARHGEKLSQLEKFHKSIIKALAKENIKTVRTNYRIKSIYSLYRKLERRGGDIEKIYDISALRIIVDNISDCYKVLGILHGIWRPLPGRIKDYIAFPKPDGYRSLHTTLFTGDGGIVEVQIKTDEMDEAAEYGTHITFKDFSPKTAGGGGASKNLQWIKSLLPKEKLSFDKKEFFEKSQESDIPVWIKELAEFQSSAKGEREFMDHLKSDFFQERIFVFTPKGDVVDLPIGSCPIDFAYTIHSDIGNRISGARINGKFVSLDTALSNGDIVEIETRQSSRPSSRWLSFVKTIAAKKHIRWELEKLEKKNTNKDVAKSRPASQNQKPKRRPKQEPVKNQRDKNKIASRTNSKR